MEPGCPKRGDSAHGVPVWVGVGALLVLLTGSRPLLGGWFLAAPTCYGCGVGSVLLLVGMVRAVAGAPGAAWDW